jgi:hypothetical protein
MGFRVVVFGELLLGSGCYSARWWRIPVGRLLRMDAVLGFIAGSAAGLTAIVLATDFASKIRYPVETLGGLLVRVLVRVVDGLR